MKLIGFVKTAALPRLLELIALSLFFMIPFRWKFRIDLSESFRSFFYPEECLLNRMGRHLQFYEIDILILIFTASSIWTYRKKLTQFFFQKERKFFTLFVLWCFATIALSNTPNLQLQYFRFIDIFLGLLLFCAISSLKIENIPRFFKTLMWGTFITAFVPCLIGTAHYFLQKPIGLSLIGEPKNFNSGFVTSDGTRCLIDHLVCSNPTPHYLIRAQGTFSHANLFAGYLLIPLILTLYLLAQEEKRGLKILLSSGLALQIFTLFTTYSRSGLYGLVLGAALLFLILAVKRLNFRTPLTALTVSLALSFTLLYPQLKERGGVMNYTSLNKNADQERLAFQNAGLAMFKDHPIVGVGFNNSFLIQPSYYKETFNFAHGRIHNIYLLIACETGIIGALLFSVFLLFLLFPFIKNFSSYIEVAPVLAIILGFLFIGMCDYYPLYHSLGKTIFVFMLGLLSLLNRVSA